MVIFCLQGLVMLFKDKTLKHLIAFMQATSTSYIKSHMPYKKLGKIVANNSRKNN